jgi:hypothetical protein
VLESGSVVEATRAPEEFRRRFSTTVVSSESGELHLELPPYALVTLDEGE